ncbi:hypothetical protein [Glycomyces salinus]|uniref:hypothetical protein n=1 Tax=Glycomyces salinus TaxID=980294 RepID=UPI0018ECE8F4|nr:hypothetical protein [Glycomyces salinus]
MVGLMARFGLGFGVFLGLSAVLLLLYLPSGSAESAVTVFTAGIAVFLVLISLVALYTERKRQ